MNNAQNIWLGRTAIQIMVDRFYKSNGQCNQLEPIEGRVLKDWNDRMPNWKPDHDGIYHNNYFYGGNLKGLEEKLSYIASLGFNMIYLTPIEKSSSYHHYDVENHMEIDPWIGNWEDFKNLCNEAKKIGIIIMVDLVFNHTGIHSIYYNDSKYSGWYKKTSTGKQIFWWGFTDLPECNTMNVNYQQAMEKVTERYLENGASGIRLDLGEDLPREFLYAIGKVKEKYPEVIMIGEMWEFASDKKDGKIYDGQVDSIMNYPMADAILRWCRWGMSTHFCYNFYKILQYPVRTRNFLLNNIGTHDTPTAITMLAGEKMNKDVFGKRIWDIEAPWLKGEKFDTYKFREFEAENDQLPKEKYILAKKLLKIAIAILYFIPGIPCLFQGTEIGEQGYKDPFSRKPYNWNNPDNEILEFVRKVGNFRKENSNILSEGEVAILRCDEEILILERFNKEGTIRLIVNRTENKVKVPNEYISATDCILVMEMEGEICERALLTPYAIVIYRVQR